MKAILIGSGMAALAAVVMLHAPTASAASAEGAVNDLREAIDHANEQAAAR